MRTGLITILRTVRSDRGSYGSLFFSHRTVLEAKRTAKMSGSRFFRLDHTVWSGFQNLALMCLIYFSSIFHNFTIILFLSRSLFLKSKLRVQNSIDLCLLGFICLIISQMLLPLIAFSNLDRFSRIIFPHSVFFFF